MTSLFFLKKQQNIRRRKKKLKSIRNFSLLELLVVISLFLSIIVTGSWWGIKKSSENKLTQSAKEITNYLNQVYAVTAYSGVDAFIEIKKDKRSGFIFETYFIHAIPKQLQKRFKKKCYVQYLDLMKFNSDLNEDIKFSFDAFLGITKKGVLLLGFKKDVQYLEIGAFPIRRDNNK